MDSSGASSGNFRPTRCIIDSSGNGNSWETMDKPNGKDANQSESYRGIIKCICHRSKATYECRYCRRSFHGRLAKLCPAHVSVIYLMDFKACPFCNGPPDGIKELEKGQNK